MIIVRSPLRITLGGGGTDLSSFYKNHGGIFISAAIDKYVYITIHETFVDDLIIKYSKLERVPCSDMVQHPIFRESLNLLGMSGRSLEISSMADIPSGTGLGSSGSFTTALLKALHVYQNEPIEKRVLAEEACHVEIDILGEPIGKQDQYVASYGDLKSYKINTNGSVMICSFAFPAEIRNNLESNLLLFFTGYTRSASEILKDQDDRTKNNDPYIEENLCKVMELAQESELALIRCDLFKFAQCLTKQWQLKRDRQSGHNNTEKLNEWINFGLDNGAWGGKVVGAGEGGFIMFYASDVPRLRQAMSLIHLREVKFKFDTDGTKVVVSG